MNENSTDDGVQKKEKRSGIELNPVLLLGLRMRMRKGSTFAVLGVYAAVVGILTALICLILITQNHNSIMGLMITRQLVGKIVFWSVTALELSAVLILTPAMMAGSITLEREQGTFDLLKTTTMPMRSIVWGKLLEGLSFSLLLAIVTIPLQSIVFLLGGIALEEVVICALLVILTASMMCSTVLFFSSREKNTLRALMWSYGSSFFLFILIPIAGLMLTPLMIGLDNSAASGPYATLADVLAILTGWILISINPVAAMAVSASLWMAHQDLFFYQYPLKMGGTLSLFSPWVLFTLICFLLSLFLFWASTHFAGKAEK